MSSRLTAAAKLGGFIFFFTDFGFIPAIPVGRTSATAAMKPLSSSTAKSVLRDPRLARHPEVGRVPGDRVDQLRRVAALLEQRQRHPRVAGLQVRVLLVVEVVEDAGRRPELLVLAVAPGVGDHRRFDPEHVPPQRLGLGPLAEELPGFVAARRGHRLRLAIGARRAPAARAGP